MKKSWAPFFIIAVIILFSRAFFSPDAHAGEAGVGVMNVPPKFSEIRIVQQDNSTLRIYLTASDYNSWEDIETVQVSLDDNGVETAKFLFQQYADATSYVKINEFSDLVGENALLVKDKCSYTFSESKETIDDRCDLKLIFVFHTTWFTRLNIILSDRAGLTSEAHIDYNAEEMAKSGNLLLIPGFPDPIFLTIPSYLLDIIAVTSAAIGTVLLVKKGRRYPLHETNKL